MVSIGMGNFLRSCYQYRSWGFTRYKTCSLHNTMWHHPTFNKKKPRSLITTESKNSPENHPSSCIVRPLVGVRYAYENVLQLPTYIISLGMLCSRLFSHFYTAISKLPYISNEITQNTIQFMYLSNTWTVGETKTHNAIPYTNTDHFNHHQYKSLELDYFAIPRPHKGHNFLSACCYTSQKSQYAICTLP